MNFAIIDPDNFTQVAEIYDQGIQTGIATFETNVPPYEVWNKKYLPFGRICLMDNDHMLGWATLSSVSDRCVYAGVAEVSVYVHQEAQGRGLGTSLLNKLIEDSEKNGIWTLQCGIMRENKASIKLHEKCGFRQIGYREKVGQLHGVWRDNIIMERRSNVVGL